MVETNTYSGQKLKKFLEDRNLGPSRVAEQLGVTRQQVYSYFHSKNLSRETVNNILTKLKAKEEEIFTPDAIAMEEDKKRITIYQTKPKTTNPDEITYTPFNQDEPPKIIGIPMYNVPASESNIEMYSDINDTSVVGYLHFPGDHKNCFALPVWGHSMYPVLENGVWVILRPIDVDDIVWGEIYFVEWGNNKMFRRILDTDREDEAILWSDNQEEKILGRAKFGPIRIKLSRIKRVYVVTGIYKKSNH